MAKLWFWLRLCVYCLLNTLSGVGSGILHPAEVERLLTLPKGPIPAMWFCVKPERVQCRKGEKAKVHPHFEDVNRAKCVVNSKNIPMSAAWERQKNKSISCASWDKKHAVCSWTKWTLKPSESSDLGQVQSRNISDNLCPLSSSRTSFKRKPCFSAHSLGNSFST